MIVSMGTICMSLEILCHKDSITCYKGLVINYGEGGGATKWENRGSETFCTPPSRQGKPFCAPLLKSQNFLRPHFNMAKTLSYCIKTTQKLVVPPPPFSMSKTFVAPSLFVGVKLHVVPSRFVAPLPVISDQSLT